VRGFLGIYVVVGCMKHGGGGGTVVRHPTDRPTHPLKMYIHTNAPNNNRLVALAAYAAGLRIPPSEFAAAAAAAAADEDEEQGEEGGAGGGSSNGKGNGTMKAPSTLASVPPLMTALCNEVEIMCVAFWCVGGEERGRGVYTEPFPDRRRHAMPPPFDFHPPTHPTHPAPHTTPPHPKTNSYQEVRLGIAEPTDKEEKLKKTVNPIPPPKPKAKLPRFSIKR
jgi:hypothetical protein